jgi:hypothetical protein
LAHFPRSAWAEARGEHAEARKLVAKGIHPVQARRQHREDQVRAELQRTKGSFAAVASDWNDATAANLRSATIKQRNREIDKDLMPRFKDRAISSLTRLELTSALKDHFRSAFISAMHLLQSGVSFNVIALWLGHENANTTHRYVEANLEMKEKTLARLEAPDIKLKRFRASDDLMKFLPAL